MCRCPEHRMFRLSVLRPRIADIEREHSMNLDSRRIYNVSLMNVVVWLDDYAE